MIETNIGQVTLTPNQLARLSTLHDTNIHGFFIDSKGVVVKSDTPIVVATVQVALTALDASPLPAEADKIEYASGVWKGMTPQQADDYIKNNVSDLASAKLVMQKMARAIMYLLRRSDLG